MNITIIGSGYVGLNTGVVLAYLKHKVTCVDKDLKKIESLQNGKSPIYEHGLENLLLKITDNIKFTTDFTQSIANADVIILTVGTPAKQNGEADISYMETALNEIVSVLKEGHHYVIVIKSTVPVGTNQVIFNNVKQILNSRRVNIEVDFVSNPEFLREGTALNDTLYPSRIVLGSDSIEAIETLHKMYLPILEQAFIPPSNLPRPKGFTLPTLVKTSLTSAEMIKYASNALLALKVSFINEIGGLCEKVGADVKEVAYGIGLDPRIGPSFLNAGVGWGGCCLPKDISELITLGKKYDYPMTIVEASSIVNNRQRQVIIEKLQSTLGDLKGRTVGILGLAFKPGTDDVRHSPAEDIIKFLIEQGVNIKAHDPIAIANAQKVFVDYKIEFNNNPYSIARNSDALVLVTEWEEYLKIDFNMLREVMNVPLIIDGRNFLNSEEIIKSGFIYKGIGIEDAIL